MTAQHSQRLRHDLESLLDQLIVEHRKLLAHVQQHAGAMRALDLGAMDAAARQQDACRLRIHHFEHRRRAVVRQMVQHHRLTTDPTLGQIAELYPLHAGALLGKRDVLRSLAGDVALRANVANKLAGAVLGHLNTAVKAIAGAVKNAGVYTKSGVPKVSSRIGMMEAVG
jgi:hypothetical protein